MRDVARVVGGSVDPEVQSIPMGCLLVAKPIMNNYCAIYLISNRL